MRLKIGHALVETSLFKSFASWGPVERIGQQSVSAFRHARVEKLPSVSSALLRPKSVGKREF